MRSVSSSLATILWVTLAGCILIGCSLPGLQDPVVGQWLQMEESRLGYLAGSGPSVLECLSDGRAILSNNSQSVQFRWRRSGSGQIVFQQLVEGRVIPGILVDVVGDSLVLTNRTGTGRFQRIKSQ